MMSKGIGMSRRVLLLVLSTAFMGMASLAADDRAAAAKSKKALQELSEFIGKWELTAETKASGKLVSWKEPTNWMWKFQGDDSWITLEMKDGKYFQTGNLKYDPAAKKYELTLKDKAGTEQLFRGEFKKQKLVLERTDDKSGDVHRLSFNTLSEGIRLAMNYDVQSGGKGLFNSVYKSVGNKEGESLAGAKTNKDPECIVTGGAAKIAVSYMGKTYHVCCSGCKDEFDANPKKYVDALTKGKK
ncbi:MAG: YHS domain-containing protein [Gemmataceae bacterium]